MLEEAASHKRLGKPAHRRCRQPGSLGQFSVAKQFRAGAEGPQYFHASFKGSIGRRAAKTLNILFFAMHLSLPPPPIPSVGMHYHIF
jgi:hypothetical protein